MARSSPLERVRRRDKRSFMLASSRPEQFFLPPYVAHLGWIGVRLDRDPRWHEIAGIVADAYRLVLEKTPCPRTAAWGRRST